MEYDFGLISLVFEIEVMINRDGWGHLYLIVRGEILGFMKDKLLRKHSFCFRKGINMAVNRPFQLISGGCQME